MTAPHPVAVEPTALLSRRQRKRERTAERIYRAAVRLFVERGFEHTTIQDITDAADVGKGTFFNYFATKEAVLERFLELRGLESLALANRSWPASVPPQERLAAILDSLADHIMEDPQFARLVLNASLRSRLMLAANRAAGDSFRAAFRHVVYDAQQRGQFRADVPPERVAEYLVALFYRVVRDRLEIGEEFDLKKRLREALGLLVRGLAVAEEARPGPR